MVDRRRWKQAQPLWSLAIRRWLSSCPVQVAREAAEGLSKDSTSWMDYSSELQPNATRLDAAARATKMMHATFCSDDGAYASTRPAAIMHDASGSIMHEIKCCLNSEKLHSFIHSFTFTSFVIPPQNSQRRFPGVVPADNPKPRTCDVKSLFPQNDHGNRRAAAV